MNKKLDIHPASPEERIQIYQNVFEFWKMAPTLEEHLQFRLNSVKHNRAKWYAGCLDGQVVVSLGCYPLRYSFNGRKINGISIGSVHTLPLFRRKGFAKQLVLWVEQDQKQKGAKISSLYSDISPQYYSRIGYLQCPSWESWIKINNTKSILKSPNWKLEKFSAATHLKELDQHYCSYHESILLGINRPLSYWKFIVLKQPNDEFYWLKRLHGQTLGYVRLTRIENNWQISDLGVNQNRSEFLQELFELVIQLARKKKLSRIGGWIPNKPVIRSLFEVRPRADSITMVKSLDTNLTIEPKHIAKADHFCQIDHV